MNIYDIANRANVSIATVSRVINNSPKVSEKTRKKVLDIVDELGFTPGSLTATDSLYKPQTLIKTGFQSYFFVNLLSILCSYL